MAVFLRLQSKKKTNENTKFGLTCVEFEFLVTAPIDVLDWPLAFSEYIINHITDDVPQTSFIGVTISHSSGSGHIPFYPFSKLTPTVFDDNFERIFQNIDSLSGTLYIQVTYLCHAGLNAYCK